MLHTGKTHDFMIVEKNNNIIISLTVKTQQLKQKIIITKNRFVVCLKSKPEKNKANAELVNILKKEFKRSAIIISGQKSKIKKVLVENTNMDEAIIVLKKHQI
ncbi:MAG: DUF167 domain-containing protein [Candidatus Aenigmarchaeota archaeon]|nr:DUF167 domain-containing protein [Candidatus Aenigmarchaeota archaeon]